jgi:nucleolar protein 56
MESKEEGKAVSQDHLRLLREKNISLTKEKISQSITEDNFISQAINSIHEYEKASNLLGKRLREWYGLYNPAFENVDQILNVQFSAKRGSMGRELSDIDKAPVVELINAIRTLNELKTSTRSYIEQLMKIYCPNLIELAGPTIGAKLLEHTGSLKKLAMLPASTIQILGAEKALFRHLKSGAKPPKYGFIHDHNFIQSGPRKEQGKRARALADKLSLAAKLDFFKGEFLAPKLKKDLEARFK